MELIRRAEDEDAEALPAIERSAGLLFRAIPSLAWIADGDDLSVERFRELIAKGASWVHVEGDAGPVAFLVGEITGAELHVWEFSVRLDRQRRGIGRALLGHVIEDARARGLRAITLTTFRGVAWNDGFYRRFGFRTLGQSELGDRLARILRREADAGLPRDRRCAMRLHLD